MNVNYTFTLCWNYVSECEKATKLLYELNDRNSFTHIIVDLGFPLEDLKDEIPSCIECVKIENGVKLKKLAKSYGSEFIQLPNEGVEKNWTAVYKALNMDNSDILAGADPDEHPINRNWVRAMGNVIRSNERIALASLMMTDHLPVMSRVKYREKIINGEKAYWIDGLLNWALIGLSGEFLNKTGGVPAPKGAEIYGWIETELLTLMNDNQYKWVILPDYLVKHTDFELGDAGTSRLLRLWKNQIIHKIKEYGQISFEEYLQKIQKGEIKI